MTDKIKDFYELPTRDFYEEIVSSVDNNQVTILTAETGAGKSTQVPQYLAEHGYDRVVVTQPRILAARNLSNRVRDEWAERNREDSTQIIGYRTAHERDDSGRTQILYCTDGLQLVREITGSGVKQKQVLVLDEVHEWNENMEVLIAWAKKRVQEEPRFKVLVMSATIETASLAQYFETESVISVPGRYFEVKKRMGTDVLSELFAQLSSPGRNILTFLPGKAEIQDVTDVISKKAAEVGVPVIPLHSQLEAESQQKAFASYPNGKIILATNIAQTSVTIDDIDMVIDSGLERRSEVRSGVEGLFIAQISQADSLQRAGRAGRTKPGEYILAPYDTLPCLAFEDREEYGVPEILRKHIDRLVLRLANVGLDIETLDFYHDPSKKSIQRAKRTLRILGAMTAKGQVTDIGRAMERFPVESKYARMLVEGEAYPRELRAKLAAIIAIQEVGGITKGGTRYSGWRKYTRQTKSDLLAQYEVYLSIPEILEDELEDLGIISKNIAKAEEVIERLHADLGLVDISLAPLSPEDEDKLLRCIVAGQLDELWTVNSRGNAEHIFTGKERELSGSTVVRFPRLISGTPFDLEVPSRSGHLETLRLVNGISVVDIDWLVELSPQLFVGRKGRIVYDPQTHSLAELQQVRFGKRVLEGVATPVIQNNTRNQKLFVKEFAKWAHGRLEQQSLGRFGRRRNRVSLNQVEREVAQRVSGIISLDNLSKHDRQSLLSLARIDSYDSSRTRRFDYEDSSDRPQGPRRRGWRAKHQRRQGNKRGNRR